MQLDQASFVHQQPCRSASVRVQVPQRLLLHAISLTLVALIFLMPFSGAQSATASSDVGRDIFEGKAAIRARMVGHADPLPPNAIRCGNCHRIDRSLPQSRSFAPILDARQLQESVSRRGGPASRFDALSLCKLLRDGIDPAWIVVPTTMPRYELSDAQCSALWSFLVRPK